VVWIDSKRLRFRDLYFCVANGAGLGEKSRSPLSGNWILRASTFDNIGIAM